MIRVTMTLFQGLMIFTTILSSPLVSLSSTGVSTSLSTMEYDRIAVDPIMSNDRRPLNSIPHMVSIENTSSFTRTEGTILSASVIVPIVHRDLDQDSTLHHTTSLGTEYIAITTIDSGVSQLTEPSAALTTMSGPGPSNMTFSEHTPQVTWYEPPVTLVVTSQNAASTAAVSSTFAIITDPMDMEASTTTSIRTEVHPRAAGTGSNERKVTISCSNIGDSLAALTPPYIDVAGLILWCALSSHTATTLTIAQQETYTTSSPTRTTSLVMTASTVPVTLPAHLVIVTAPAPSGPSVTDVVLSTVTSPPITVTSVEVVAPSAS